MPFLLLIVGIGLAVVGTLLFLGYIKAIAALVVVAGLGLILASK